MKLELRRRRRLPFGSLKDAFIAEKCIFMRFFLLVMKG